MPTQKLVINVNVDDSNSCGKVNLHLYDRGDKLPSLLDGTGGFVEFSSTVVKDGKNGKLSPIGCKFANMIAKYHDIYDHLLSKRIVFYGLQQSICPRHINFNYANGTTSDDVNRMVGLTIWLLMKSYDVTTAEVEWRGYSRGDIQELVACNDKPESYDFPRIERQTREERDCAIVSTEPVKAITQKILGRIDSLTQSSSITKEDRKSPAELPDYLSLRPHVVIDDGGERTIRLAGQIYSSLPHPAREADVCRKLLSIRARLLNYAAYWHEDGMYGEAYITVHRFEIELDLNGTYDMSVASHAVIAEILARFKCELTRKNLHVSIPMRVIDYDDDCIEEVYSKLRFIFGVASIIRR